MKNTDFNEKLHHFLVFHTLEIWFVAFNFVKPRNPSDSARGPFIFACSNFGILDFGNRIDAKSGLMPWPRVPPPLLVQARAGEGGKGIAYLTGPRRLCQISRLDAYLTGPRRLCRISATAAPWSLSRGPLVEHVVPPLVWLRAAPGPWSQQAYQRRNYGGIILELCVHRWSFKGRNTLRRCRHENRRIEKNGGIIPELCIPKTRSRGEARKKGCHNSDSPFGVLSQTGSGIMTPQNRRKLQNGLTSAMLK